MKVYRAVAGPQNIQVAKGNTQAAFDSFAQIINNEARAGWTYHSMETITVTEAPGCFRPAIPHNYYMLIFVREQ